jgi:hypothetical protein
MRDRGTRPCASLIDSAPHIAALMRATLAAERAGIDPPFLVDLGARQQIDAQKRSYAAR